MRFAENDKVLVNACRVPWDEVTIGTVESIVEHPTTEIPVYIVRLETSELVKCFEEDLEEVKPDDIETVTLTREEFVHALAKACTPGALRKLIWKRNVSPLMISELRLAGIIIGHSLENVLFGEKAEND